MVKISPGSRTDGTSAPQEMLWPRARVSAAGIKRSAPSRKPMYQSGCEPVEALSGRYGPNAQTGLTWASAPIAASTAKTVKKRPTVRVRNCGKNGMPTTLRLVRPRPAQCVCLSVKTSCRCAPTSATISPGTSRMCIEYSRGMMSWPGYSPPKAKNDR